MATIIGSEYDDRLNGTPSNDLIQSLGGADALNCGNGDESIDGGKGSNTAFGGSGEDTIAIDGGADTIDGGSAPATLTRNVGAHTFVFTHFGGTVDAATEFRGDDKSQLAARASRGSRDRPGATPFSDLASRARSLSGRRTDS